MAHFISISANHKYVEKILDKAKELKSSIVDEISWHDGFKYSAESRRNIKVFSYSDPLWNYILELEPTVEEVKKARRVKNGLLTAAPEDILKYSYDEPGKK